MIKFNGENILSKEIYDLLSYKFIFKQINMQKMNFYVFEQIPKFAPEKYWAEGGVYPSAPGAARMASYCDPSVLPEKTI